MSISWSFFKKTADNACPALTTEYMDTTAQQIYISENGRIVSTYGQIDAGNWEGAVFGENTDIGGADGAMFRATHEYNGEIWASCGNQILRYKYIQDISDLIISADTADTSDSPIRDISVSLRRPDEGMIDDYTTLFCVGGKITVDLMMGDSAKERIITAYCDEHDWSQTDNTMTVRARNAIGYFLSDATFDERTKYTGTRKGILYQMLEYSGIPLYTLIIENDTTEVEYEFKYNDRKFDKIKSLLTEWGWKIAELPDGKVLIGSQTLFNTYAPKGTHTYDKNTQGFEYHIVQRVDSSYSRIAVVSASEETNGEPIIEYRDLSTFRGWGLPKKTKYIDTLAGTPREIVAALADEYKKAYDNIGVTAEIRCPVRPCVAPGDLAVFANADVYSYIQRGIITSVRHTYGVSGVMTRLTVDSGGTVIVGADGRISTYTAIDVDGDTRRREMLDEINRSANSTVVAYSNLSESGGGKETDPTVPSWAKQPEKPTYTAAEVGALPYDTEIPSYSAATQSNDGLMSAADKIKLDGIPEGGGGGITEETDPTVPSWAKQSKKPTYTAAEVGADSDGSADSALTAAKKYTDEKVKTNVPENAVFTDTVYDDTELVRKNKLIEAVASEQYDLEVCHDMQGYYKALENEFIIYNNPNTIDGAVIVYKILYNDDVGWNFSEPLSPGFAYYVQIVKPPTAGIDNPQDGTIQVLYSLQNIKANIDQVEDIRIALNNETTERANGDGALQDSLYDHINDTSNPHSVTKSQVGLGNVDNTSDADKPISAAMQTALNKKLDKSGGTISGDSFGFLELKRNTEWQASIKFSNTKGNLGYIGMQDIDGDIIHTFGADTSKQYPMLDSNNYKSIIGNSTSEKSGLMSPSDKSMLDNLTAILGYDDDDIVGLQVDYANCIFTRLAGAKNLTAGADFDKYTMFGGRRRCNVADDGTINAYYGDAGYTEDGSNGQVMVYQPVFYYYVVPLVYDKQETGIGYHLRKANYYVSDMPKPNFKRHPAFYDENGNEVDYILLSAYEGSIYDTSESVYLFHDEQVADFTEGTGDKLCSIAGVKPASGLTQNLTIVNAEILSKNRGTGWHCDTIKSVSANQMLMMIEMGMLNMQTAIGKGVSEIPKDNSSNLAVFTGSTASLGNSTGEAVSSFNESNGVQTTYAMSGKVSVTYRGMENPYGNIFKYIKGFNIFDLKPYICTDFQFSEEKITDNYANAEFSVVNGKNYISAFGYSQKYDWLFLTSEVSGNSNLPVGDDSWISDQYSNICIARFGGYLGSGTRAGMFYWFCIDDQYAHSKDIGARLFYVPTAKI